MGWQALGPRRPSDPRNPAQQSAQGGRAGGLRLAGFSLGRFPRLNPDLAQQLWLPTSSSVQQSSDADAATKDCLRAPELGPSCRRAGGGFCCAVGAAQGLLHLRSEQASP